MKRRLALLVGGLVVAGGAQAQTSVTLYGIADGDLRFDHTSIGTLRSVGSGGEAASRWGIRGTEDLGGGLKAVFNFEEGLDLSDNSASQGNIAPATPTTPASSTGSRLFGRRAIVGLNSATLGEIRIGREYTPYYQVWATADPFGTGTVGRATNIAIGNVTRVDNGATYESPAIHGFVGKLQWKPGESTTSAAASGALKNGGNAIGGSLTYAAGPLYAGVGYVAVKNALDNNTTRSYTGVAVYDFGVAKAHGLYFRTQNASTVRQQSYAGGITVPIQALKVLALVSRIDNRYDTNNSPLKFNDALFLGAGVSYAFSKRTDLYSSVAKFRNHGGAAFTISDNSNAGLYTATNVPAGFDPWSAQFGIRHLF